MQRQQPHSGGGRVGGADAQRQDPQRPPSWRRREPRLLGGGHAQQAVQRLREQRSGKNEILLCFPFGKFLLGQNVN